MWYDWLQDNWLCVDTAQRQCLIEREYNQLEIQVNILNAKSINFEFNHVYTMFDARLFLVKQITAEMLIWNSISSSICRQPTTYAGW